MRILLQTAGITLGTGLATLANMLDPQAIILGGGVGRASATYRKGLRAGLAFAVWPKGRNLPYVFSAALGADAGLVGAGLLGSGLVAQTGSNFP